MTIYQIKQATQATAPYFFERKTLRFFGQTMRDFRTYKQPDGRVMICAPMYNNGRKIGETVRFFNPINNKLETK